MTTQTPLIRKAGITAKAFRQAALALVCTGCMAFGAQAAGHTSDHLTKAVYDGVESAEVQAVGYRGYKRSLKYGSRGFSSRRYSRYGYSGLGYGYSGKKYRSGYYYGNSFRNRSFKGSRRFSRSNRFGSSRRFRSSRY